MARKPSKLSAAEAAVLELQNAPANVAREEARHAADVMPGASPRQRKADPKPAKRRGRPKGSKNKVKAPVVKRRGRPKGSKNKPKSAVVVRARRAPRVLGRPAKTPASGLGQIRQVVEQMVAERTREVLGQALAALQKAQAAVRKAM